MGTSSHNGLEVPHNQLPAFMKILKQISLQMRPVLYIWATWLTPIPTLKVVIAACFFKYGVFLCFVVFFTKPNEFR